MPFGVRASIAPERPSATTPSLPAATPVPPPAPISVPFGVRASIAPERPSATTSSLPAATPVPPPAPISVPFGVRASIAPERPSATPSVATPSLPAAPPVPPPAPISVPFGVRAGIASEKFAIKSAKPAGVATPAGAPDVKIELGVRNGVSEPKSYLAGTQILTNDTGGLTNTPDGAVISGFIAKTGWQPGRTSLLPSDQKSLGGSPFKRQDSPHLKKKVLNPNAAPAVPDAPNFTGNATLH